MNPFPDQRDLYMLLAGVIVGVLLSPAILGRVAPDTYNQLFVGGTGEQRMEAQDRYEYVRDSIADLISSDVTPIAIEEHLQTIRMDAINPIATLEEIQREHQEGMMGMLVALMLAVGVVMIVETLVSPWEGSGHKQVVPATVGRLKSLRYALVAVWFAMLLANPALIWNLPWLFILIVLAVAVALSFIPLGFKKTQQI